MILLFVFPEILNGEFLSTPQLIRETCSKAHAQAPYLSASTTHPLLRIFRKSVSLGRKTLVTVEEQIGQSAFYESIDYPADEALASAVEEGIAAVEQARGKFNRQLWSPAFVCRMDDGSNVGAYSRQSCGTLTLREFSCLQSQCSFFAE